MSRTSHKIIVIGSGFGGQCAAIRLMQMGETDFQILERRNFMGGTWAQNTYPGAAVDVPSPLYSLSFELKPWSQMFAEQSELAEYTNSVIEKYGLREKTLLNTDVAEIRWDEDKRRWMIDTTNGRGFEAQIVINATGILSTPSVPDFPGKEDFKGVSFHTNDWDHSFDYKGKRVAVIGSGASAAQVIPAIAEDVSELHVFQRTPHWVMPRPDRKFTRLERWLLGFKWYHRLLRSLIYWEHESRVVGFKYSHAALKFFAQRKALNLLKKQVKDPELRKKLTPDYTIGCKRIILSSTLYPALTRDNVTLHDKDDGIARVTEGGIETTGGRHVELDAIVWSTGYDATDGLISYPVIGRGGKALASFWSEYPRAYLGTTMPNFPNLFICTGPNTGIGHTSAIFIIEAQMDYVMECVKRLNQRRAETIEVSAKAEDGYTTMIHTEMKKTVWETGGCNSWYKTKSGKVIAMYPGFTFTYSRMTRNFRSKDHVMA